MRFFKKSHIVSLVAALALCAVPCMSKAAITLTYASNGPEQSIRGYAEKLFLDEIEAQTNGKIKVTAFWSNTLVSGNELLKGIADGIVDMGFINSNFFPKAMPYSNAITLNEFGPTTGAELVALYQELYDKIPALREEYAKHKQRPVYFFATDCNAFASNKPIDDLSQLKGMKARASSRWKLADFKAMGATPVSVAWSECYMALQSGTVETILTSVESHHRGKLYEVGPYLWIWEKMWLGTPYVISINEKKFKKLDKELQDAIIRAGKIASEKFAKKFDADVKKEIADMEKAGAKVVYATDKDYDAWRKLPSLQGNADTWMKEAKALKLKDPEKVFEEIRTIVEKYTK